MRVVIHVARISKTITLSAEAWQAARSIALYHQIQGRRASASSVIENLILDFAEAHKDDLATIEKIRADVQPSLFDSGK